MITNLQKIRTKLVILHNVPKAFFSKIESATGFSDDLFPSWFDNVFSATDLSQKFENVYNRYKAIPLKADRDKIINAFRFCNEVEKLCSFDISVSVIKLEDLDESIREEVDVLFLALYKSSLKYHVFETFVGDTIGAAIDRFIKKNRLSVCPFCGIETYLNLMGQSRLPLDHWLYKDAFPMAAVNFKNLIPIGKDCNDRGVKGDKNIVIDKTSGNRVKAYYPYSFNAGVSVTFNFIKEPNGHPVKETDWQLSITANSATDNDIFTSWKSTMNIDSRYTDYLSKNVIDMWEEEYEEFILNPDTGLTHASNVTEFKNNLTKWRGNFNVKVRPGSIVYKSFIDFLLTTASDGYLTGLLKNFKRV